MDPEITRSILYEIHVAQERGKEPCILFDRVSHMKQTDGVSLEHQGAGGEAYAERNNLHVAYAFSVVESAYKENRKHLHKILDLAEAHGIKNLIFKNVDRLSRNISHVDRFKRLIEECGFTFHFYETASRVHRDSSYDEKWLFYFFILIAQRLSMKNSSDVKGAYKYKASKGVPNFRPPDGYSWDKAQKLPVINKGRENVLRLIFDEWDSGRYSLQSLCDFLNARALKTSTGRDWKTSHLHRILCNPFYCGKFILHGQPYEGIYEPYFPAERLEKRLERLGQKAGKFISREFPFSRILRCADCGAVLSGDLKKGRYVYYSHRCGKVTRTISEASVVELLDEQAAAISMNDEFAQFLKDSFTSSISMKEKSQEGDVSAISRRISDLEIKVKRLMQLFADDRIPADLLQSQIEDFQKERAHLVKEREGLAVDKEKFIVTVADIIGSIRRFSKVYAVSPVEGKAALVREIAGKVIIGTQAEIVFKEPFSIILKKELRAIKELAGPVREFPTVHARRDEFRTLLESYIESASHEIILYMAA